MFHVLSFVLMLREGSVCCKAGELLCQFLILDTKFLLVFIFSLDVIKLKVPLFPFWKYLNSKSKI